MQTRSLGWLFAGLIVFGCGGSGGSGTGVGPTPGRAHVAVFITDAPLTSFSQVWVKILKVELVSPSGAAETVFESATGQVVDLASLNRAGQSQYALLNMANVTAGQFKRVRFTLDEHVSLIPKGGGAAAERTFAGSAGGVVQLNFELEKEVEGTSNLVADFDLAKWTEDGTFVVAVVKQGKGEGLEDDHNHVAEDYEGKIAGLTGTAPNLTFTLAREKFTLPVKTDATTSIFNADGTPNPSLTNGNKIRVQGAFDAATRTIKATEIRIEKGETHSESEAEAKGSVTVESANGFTLQVAEAEHFMPANGTVDVVVTDATIFFSHGGVKLTRDEFFTALAVGSFAEAEGDYDPATNTVAARKVKLEDGSHHDGELAEAEVKGSIANLDATAKTFQIAAQEWEGFQLASGAVVSVKVTAGTDYQGRSGKDHLTVAQFFTSIANGSKVSANGTFDAASGVLTAQRLRLRNGGDDSHGG